MVVVPGATYPDHLKEMPKEEYISPYQKERELIDRYEADLLKLIWKADKDFDLGVGVTREEIESRVGKIASSGNKLLKSYKDLAKDGLKKGSKERFKSFAENRERKLIEIQDTLLKNLLDASPKGSPIRSLNSFEFVLLLKDFDPLILALTSPVHIKSKPEGDYLLLQFEQVYLRFINRSKINLRDRSQKIKWRIPKGWFPANETEVQRTERIKAGVKRTVQTPDPEDFSEELNPDLSKFAVPKVEYIADDGWEPDDIRTNLLDEQYRWLNTNGSKEAEEAFRKNQNRSDQKIQEYHELNPPSWFWIVQYVDEINSISLEKGLSLLTYTKAVREYLIENKSIFKGKEWSNNQQWNDAFRIAGQFVYIGTAPPVIEE